MRIIFEQMTAVFTTTATQITNLLKQLHPNEPIPDLSVQKLEQLALREGTTVMLAHNADVGTEIIGMASLIIGHTLEGPRGYIENVVVDERYRRLGIGRELNMRLIRIAKSRGVEYLELTSGDHRTGAHVMYVNLGFTERHDTLCYEMHLK